MLMFNRGIVEVIIGDLLFDQDDEATQSTRDRVLAVFKPLEDAAVMVDDSDLSARYQDLNREAHRFKIMSVRRFKMITGFILMGYHSGALLDF